MSRPIKREARRRGKGKGRKTGGEERRKSVASRSKSTLLCPALWYWSQTLLTVILCQPAYAGRTLQGHSIRKQLPFWSGFLTWKAQFCSTQTFWQVSLQPSRPLWWTSSAHTFCKVSSPPSSCVCSCGSHILYKEVQILLALGGGSFSKFLISSMFTLP